VRDGQKVVAAYDPSRKELQFKAVEEAVAAAS
jgi:hypothetical protein